MNEQVKRQLLEIIDTQVVGLRVRVRESQDDVEGAQRLLERARNELNERQQRLANLLSAREELAPSEPERWFPGHPEQDGFSAYRILTEADYE